MPTARFAFLIRPALAGLCCLPFPVAGAAAQSREGITTVVRVVEALTGRPIQNAEVSLRDAGVRRLTDARGEARLTGAPADAPGPGAPRLLRVRQIGFQFVERSLLLRAGAPADTLVVELSRVAVNLPATESRAASTCGAPADSASGALSLLALEQLRLGAEQYDAFRRTYPFEADVIRRTLNLGKDGKVKRVREDLEHTAADAWGEPYKPGGVMRATPVGFSVVILFLSALAEPLFWEHHCLVATGVEQLHDRRVVPLKFTPAPTLTTPDWAGTAWLDSATSVIQRIEFRLVGLDATNTIRQLEGYMTFTTPSPYIAMPDSVVAGWWWRRSTGEKPDVVELLRTDKVRYVNRRP